MNILSIFTCEAHKDRISKMEESWIPKAIPTGFELYYVYGKAEQATEEGRNLYLPCEESYEYLLDKTYHTLKYLSDKDFEYWIKLDNDIFIPDFEIFTDKIREISGEGFDCATTSFARYNGYTSQTWHYGKVSQKLRVPQAADFPKKWLCGYCYIISKKFCKIALEHLEKTKQYKLPVTQALEDVVISNILFSNGAKCREIGPLVIHEQ